MVLLYTLPLVTLRDCALLPGVRQRLLVGRPGTVATLNQVGRGEICFLQQQHPMTLRPRMMGQLYEVGCIGVVHRREPMDHGERVYVDGVRRVLVRKLIPRLVQLAAEVEDAPALLSEDAGVAAQELFKRPSPGGDQAPATTPSQFVYALAAGVAGPCDRQPILAAACLDTVLSEVLEQLDRAAGGEWLQ